MKRIIKVLIGVTSLVLLVVFATGCADKVDRKTLREEQERLAKYTIQKFEDVKKIEFTSFEQNTSTRTWSADVVINEVYHITYSLNRIGDNQIGIGYHVEDSEGKMPVSKKESDKDININNIEIKYFED